jgi:hypothetical protein
MTQNIKTRTCRVNAGYSHYLRRNNEQRQDHGQYIDTLAPHIKNNTWNIATWRIEHILQDR